MYSDAKKNLYSAQVFVLLINVKTESVLPNKCSSHCELRSVPDDQG